MQIKTGHNSASANHCIRPLKSRQVSTGKHTTEHDNFHRRRHHDEVIKFKSVSASDAYRWPLQTFY